MINIFLSLRNDTSDASEKIERRDKDNIIQESQSIGIERELHRHEEPKQVTLLSGSTTI